MSVYLSPQWLLNQWMDFNWTCYEYHVTGVHSTYVLFNLLPLINTMNMAFARTADVGATVEPLNAGAWNVVW
jgi:hypothetical protein